MGTHSHAKQPIEPISSGEQRTKKAIDFKAV
jgi:hypothetical protein